MSDLAIRVERLSKQYRVGRRAEPYKTLRDSISRAATAPFRSLGRLRRRVDGEASGPETFWALDDVSFEVGRGEVVGIIGRNGAGKSTLLKVLSRITEPTAGFVEIRGRVGSLLEVGTGFHPELTGRDNVLLNGSILGMKRREVLRRFDEIVAFAEVEKFIDTPVKHYSSGMYLRLAFAVAAHLEPEILLVDEVLAVGDFAFQRKCLGKMGEVADAGRTVLFVSHNLGAIAGLCQSGVVLERGRLALRGPISDALDRYSRSVEMGAGCSAEFPARPGLPVQLLGAAVTDREGAHSGHFDVGEPIAIELTVEVRERLVGSNLALSLSRNGTDLFCSFDSDANAEVLAGREPGLHRYRIDLPAHLFKPGLYAATLATGQVNRGVIESHTDCLTFRIEEVFEDASLKGYAERRAGAFRVPLDWREVEAR